MRLQMRLKRDAYWVVSGENEDLAHVRSFVDAVRGRTSPVEDARFGHRAAACAHMINQSIREGRLVKWDADRNTVATA